MNPSYGGLLLVVAVAFAAPFVLGLFPRLRLPSVVLEIILGIVIGPSVLGWVHIDEPIQVLSLIGLAFLLFLAGLEIEFDHLRGRLLKLAALGWVASFVLAVVVGLLAVPDRHDPDLDADHVLGLRGRLGPGISAVVGDQDEGALGGDEVE